MQWGAPDGDRQRQRLLGGRAAAIMGDLAAELADGRTASTPIIVDEAQDFADSWWAPVLKALRDEEEGGLYVYSDENQRIFARFGRPPVAAGPARARPQPAQHQADPRVVRAAGAEPDVRRAAATGPTCASCPPAPEEALDVADDAGRRAARRGLEAGATSRCSPPATGTRCRSSGPSCPRPGRATGDASGTSDEVFYGHVLGCKGLERAAVVLCVNECRDRDRARERLYVGMSRATDSSSSSATPTSYAASAATRSRGAWDSGDCGLRRRPLIAVVSRPCNRSSTGAGDPAPVHRPARARGRMSVRGGRLVTWGRSMTKEPAGVRGGHRVR